MMSKREKLSRKGGWEDDGVTILNREFDGIPYLYLSFHSKGPTEQLFWFSSCLRTLHKLFLC